MQQPWSLKHTRIWIEAFFKPKHLAAIVFVAHVMEMVEFHVRRQQINVHLAKYVSCQIAITVFQVMT